MADSDRTRMVQLIQKSPANHEYFFDNLDDPAWLPALADAGFFGKPPEPERGSDWIRFPSWAESRYLVRIAPHAPAEVLKLATAIPETENVRVHEDLLRIAAQIPGEMSASLARQEARWLREYTGHLMSLPGAAGELLAYLGQEGQTSAAFEFAAALLQIVPAEGEVGHRRKAVGRTSEHSYQHAIQRAWPVLLKTDPDRALGFLCDRLSDVVRIGFTEPEEGYDSSSAWRSAIEDNAQNLGGSLLDILVDAVRDQALEIARTEAGLTLVLDELAKHTGKLFERVRLHLVRERGPAAMAAESLTNLDFARDTDLWHEYGELLRARFPDLPAESKAVVLQTIMAGPEEEPWPDEGRTDADVGGREARWRLQRLVLIADHIEGDARGVYEILLAEHDKPEHPTFLTYVTSWSGPTSPLSSDELQAMGPAGVLTMLREWTPAEEDSREPTPEGLGRIFQETVAGDPVQFAAEAREFVGVDPTYVRALLGGLADAAKEARPFAWDPVLSLCDWVVSQPRKHRDVADGAGRDPHWGWARKQVASLVSRGFAPGPGEIGFTERARVWNLLTALAEDPDPTAEHEERYGDDIDPATLSINTTRGETMHAVIRYLLWVESTLDLHDEGEGTTQLGEVKNLLERHLDLSVDSSRGIRSVYGQWFPQLVRIDKDWSRAIACQVFPTSSELGEYFDAAWSAYIVFNRAFADVYDVLEPFYAVAVQRLETKSGRSPFAGDPRERLGSHLITFHIQGVASSRTDHVWEFWRAAPSDLRRAVLTRVGWSLQHAPLLDADVHERLVTLWESICSGSTVDDPGSLSGFGAWLGSTALDQGWLLKQALAVLELDVYLEPDFAVYGALPRLAQVHPLEAVEVLRRMILTDPEDWSVHGSTDEVGQVLTAALGADDSETVSQATALVNLLGARGLTTFRDLITGH